MKSFAVSAIQSYINKSLSGEMSLQKAPPVVVYGPVGHNVTKVAQEALENALEGSEYKLKRLQDYAPSGSLRMRNFDSGPQKDVVLINLSAPDNPRVYNGLSGLLPEQIRIAKKAALCVISVDNVNDKNASTLSWIKRDLPNSVVVGSNTFSPEKENEFVEKMKTLHEQGIPVIRHSLNMNDLASEVKEFTSKMKKRCPNAAASGFIEILEENPALFYPEAKSDNSPSANPESWEKLIYEVERVVYKHQAKDFRDVRDVRFSVISMLGKDVSNEFFSLAGMNVIESSKLRADNFFKSIGVDPDEVAKNNTKPSAP